MSEIQLDVEDAVATITLAAPERRNALTPAMAVTLLDYCDAVDADDSIGAVLVRGLGPGFCAGADRAVLARAAAHPDDPEAAADVVRNYRCFERIAQLAVPTVAAIRGAAVGAGVNLAFATDLRIVAEDARLIAGFAALGIHPGGGHFTLLARAAGREVASALGLFGQEISGRRAAEIGAAWEALPADRVEERARELAVAVAADPELARLITRTMRLELAPPGMSLAAAIELERAPQLWSLERSAQRAGKPS